MAILASHGFDYRVVLKRDAGVWRGRANGADREFRGLIGDQPHVEVAGNVLSLRRTDDVSSYAPSHYGMRGAPLRVSVSIHELLSASIRDGDCLHLTRAGYGDLGLRLFRGNDLIAGLGSIVYRHRIGLVTTRPDPRSLFFVYSSLRPALADPLTSLVWIDASTTTDASQILDRLPTSGRAIVAITGSDPADRVRLHIDVGERRATRMLPAERWAEITFTDIDTDVFPTQEDWLLYMRDLPQTRPADLYCRFEYDGRREDVLEGGTATLPPWLIAVRRVRTVWEAEQLGIVRDTDVDPETLHAAIRHCYESRLDISSTNETASA